MADKQVRWTCVSDERREHEAVLPFGGRQRLGVVGRPGGALGRVARLDLDLLLLLFRGLGRLLGGYGSGSGRKTRLLLQALEDVVAYTPVEISRTAVSTWSAPAPVSDLPALGAALREGLRDHDGEALALKVMAGFEGPAPDDPPAAEALAELRGLLDLMLDDRLKQQENEALAANDLRLYQQIHARRKARTRVKP